MSLRSCTIENNEIKMHLKYVLTEHLTSYRFDFHSVHTSMKAQRQSGLGW